MEVGKSKIVERLLKFCSAETRANIDDFVTGANFSQFTTFQSQNEVNNVFNESIQEFLSSLSEQELLDLRTYTGYQFRNINNILRNTWNYEENGVLNDEIKIKYMLLAEKISRIISKYKAPNINFVTYRGTDIFAFKNYGIKELADLEKLKGNYLYEEGFTSTSLIEENSYFGKQLDDGRLCNVEIKYFVMNECEDGALLYNQNLSYSDTQIEYVLDKSALGKVTNVEINQNNNTAIISVIVIPKSRWNELSFVTEKKI